MLTVAQAPRLLTIRETAARLGVSTDTVRRRIASGELPAVQLGGKGTSIRIDPKQLEAWLYGDEGPAVSTWTSGPNWE